MCGGVCVRFKKARTIAPLYTAGAVAVTSDGKRLVSCVAEEMLLTDVESGEEICRFVGVGVSFFLLLFSGFSYPFVTIGLSTYKLALYHTVFLTSPRVHLFSILADL